MALGNTTVGFTPNCRDIPLRRNKRNGKLFARRPNEFPFLPLYGKVRYLGSRGVLKSGDDCPALPSIIFGKASKRRLHLDPLPIIHRSDRKCLSCKGSFTFLV